MPPLRVGGPRPLPEEVPQKELPRAFSSSFGALLGALCPVLQGSTFVEALAVTLERGPVEPKASGSLAFGNALLHRLDYLSFLDPSNMLSCLQ